VLFHDLKIGIVPNAFIRHDSTKVTEGVTTLFSDRFFKNYLKDIFVKYADINYNFDDNTIAFEINKLYKLILVSLLKFNFANFNGYRKQLFLFKNNIISINKSRSINAHLNSNHLDL